MVAVMELKSSTAVSSTKTRSPCRSRADTMGSRRAASERL
jgi:hypothetical protein